MIVAVCANPALDVTYRIQALVPGGSHPVIGTQRRAGGKGTNVARVLHRLGAPVRLVAPLGASDGDRYAAEVAGAGIALLRVPVAVGPRTSVCVVDDDATIFNEPGGPVSAPEWQALVETVAGCAASVVVLAGSLPPGAPVDGYAELARAVRPARVVVDAHGPALAATLAATPYVVAPNAAEAAAVTGMAEPLAAARALRARGAGAAVVSAGADGLVAATSDGEWRARPPRRLTGNPTGAGDALTAALALGLFTGDAWPDVLRSAVATSAAAVACSTAGEIDPAVRTRLLADVLLEEAGDGARRDR